MEKSANPHLMASLHTYKTVYFIIMSREHFKKLVEK
jgi:hypothetical protein